MLRICFFVLKFVYLSQSLSLGPEFSLSCNQRYKYSLKMVSFGTHLNGKTMNYIKKELTNVVISDLSFSA